jgi:hypothetical protein
VKFACEIALAILVLSSCASHNSHRVDLDLASQFDPLIDQAYEQLLMQWPSSEPGGRMATRIAVEPVSVRWTPTAVDPAAPADPLEQGAMAQRIEQRLQELMGGPPDPAQASDYFIEAKLETDLHDPETITYGLRCTLASTQKPGKVMARGYSGLVQLPRLFCHGCNEAWSGLGSRLVEPSVHSYTGDTFVGVSAVYCSPSSGSSSGYIKVR